MVIALSNSLCSSGPMMKRFSTYKMGFGLIIDLTFAKLPSLKQVDEYSSDLVSNFPLSHYGYAAELSYQTPFDSVLSTLYPSFRGELV